MSKLYISAEKFMNDCFHLGNMIYESDYKPDIVLGIWRGGSIPAIVVHEYLRFRKLNVTSAVITTKSYIDIGKQSDEVEIDMSEKVLIRLKNASKILIVDDVVDTGKTIEAIYKKFDNMGITAKVKVASVYYKPKTSSVFPYYHLYETEKWIVFPHELEGLLPDEIKEKKIIF